ncbi:hypothetical protein [Melioribacter roseus]|nr:hypothetical protein [Melioribacter roseus]
MKKLTILLYLTIFIVALACEEGEKYPPEFSLSALLYVKSIKSSLK